MSSQVKRKAAEADEMIRQMAAQNQAPSDEAPTEDAQPEEQAEAEVVAFESPTEQTEQDTGENDERVGDYDKELAELREQARKADARWRSLQGQIDSKDRQIEQLHTLLGKLQSEPPQPTETPQPVGITPEDSENFGDDMIDLIQRVAQQVAGQSVKSKIESMEQELKSVTQFTASSVQESFETKLTKLAPSWEKLNADEAFIGWLQESPSRLEGFQAAAGKKDAVGTADYFNMYAKLNGLDEAPSKRKRDQIEKQIAPGKARNPAPPAASTPEEKNWTRSEIADVYRSKAKYSAEEFAKLEREISNAMATDRVDYLK